MARRRAATDAERALWALAMRDVRRLDPEAHPIASVEPTVEGQQPEPSIPAVETAADPPRKAQRPGPVDRMTLERLRQGNVSVDGRIDLHGMDQRQAFAALMGFLENSVRSGRRSLLVITGKGALSQGGGVLRRNVPQWLMASPFSRRILTIAAAHTRHGGEGALYVILRKAR
jgi:DNA-nicking Smr family endonuclease